MGVAERKRLELRRLVEAALAVGAIALADLAWDEPLPEAPRTPASWVGVDVELLHVTEPRELLEPIAVARDVDLGAIRALAFNLGMQRVPGPIRAHVP